MDLDLILDNPTGIYHPGELIVGKVVVKLQEERRLNGNVQIPVAKTFRSNFYKLLFKMTLLLIFCQYL